MVKRNLVTAAVLAASLVITPAQAVEAMTGNDLLRFCSADEGLCLGLISGAAAGVQAGTYCAAGAIPLEQARDIVVKYIKDNPAQQHLPMDDLVGIAMADAFPCDKRE